MLSTILPLGVLLATIVSAQTPASDFAPITDAPLLAYSNPANVSLEPPSKLLAPSEVAYSPSLYLPSGYPDRSPYIGVQVDANIGLLHWMQPNLVPKSDGNLTVDSSVHGASQEECPYLEPEPPAQPHRYVILLFEQPANWTIPANYSRFFPPATIYDRLNFSIPDFMSSTGLSGPIGATFFRALNGTAQQSSIAAMATVGSAAPASGTPAATTTSGTVSAPVATYTAGAASFAGSMVGMTVAAVGGCVLLL